MSLMPVKTAISDVYPNPDNATANAGFGALWDALYEATEKPELDLASAATVNIGGQLSTKLRITGTTGITSFGTTYRGPILIRFAAALTLTHNATTLILPGGANLTTSAGGVCIAYPKVTTSGTFDGWIVAFSSDYYEAKRASALVKNNLVTTQSIPNNTVTAINFADEDHDTASIHDNVTNNSRLTVPAGYAFAQLSATVLWAANTTGRRLIFWRRNGGSSSLQTQQAAGAGDGVLDDPMSFCSGRIAVVPGDYFELMVWQNSGAALNVRNGGSTFFSIELSKS